MSKIEKVEYSHYAEWLSGQRWSYWCTFTTKYELTVKSARRLMDRFHSRNNKTIPTTMFWVVEQFKSKAGCHVHALLRVEADLPKNAVWQALFENYQTVSGAKREINNNRAVFKTFNRVKFADYQPEKSLECAKYCCKYVMKEQNKLQAEFDIYLPLSIQNFNKQN